MKRVTGPALELHPVSRPRGISLRPAGKMPYLRPVWSRGAFGARHPSRREERPFSALAGCPVDRPCGARG
jgi:hypothetical protein